MSISNQQLNELIEALVLTYSIKKVVKADELMDKLEKQKISPEQIEAVYDALKENQIEVVDSYDELAAKDNELLNQLEKEVSMDDPVKVYLKDIGKIALLSTEEETELAERMMQGDEAAKKRLSEANLRLVVSMLKDTLVEVCTF